MNKETLIATIAQRSNVSRINVAWVLDEYVGLTKEILSQDGKVLLYGGMGKLLIRKRAKKLARNLTTGEQVLVPAHKTVGYRISAEVKRLVNKPSRRK